ncbi:hypothetical protein B0T14DRAFT_560342 [Immersiella caudata]|uniref:Uncharacterized protein n=1 Tax=Immersiella caudata TaxID=314043 RepID=A0AA39XEV1_9PEZI|nr:hypothetical protein B0T14DRAFT_560342 [Immersiella caudata]
MTPPRHSHHHHRHHDDNLIHRPSVRLYGDEAPRVAPDFLFCVELGLLVRSRNIQHTDVSTLMDEVSARLRDVGLANHIHYDGTRESHKDWTLVEDRTIPTQPADHRFGMRVVSPFFRFGPGHAETWLPLLDVVMSVLNYDFELTTHHQCNTSVHVVPSRGYWHLSEAKGLATSAIYFERCLDALMPYYRRRTIWAKSNRHNPYMGKRTVPACVAAIHGQTTTIRQLAAHMNWCGADTPTGEALGQTSDFPHESFRWNFLAKSLLGGTGDGYRTIEFRQPPGSTDAAEAIKWVMLVGCFARLSCAFSVRTDDKPSLFALGKWVRYEARICGFGRLYVDELKRMFERADVPQFDFSAGRDPEVISLEEGARLRWKETWNCNVGQRKYTELSKKTQKLRSQRA